MAAQIFLITPLATEPDNFPRKLMLVLAAAEVSALLVRRGGRDDAAYAAWLTTIVNVGQGAGVAVLVEDDHALARRVGADGVHVTTGVDGARDAIKALKPSLIVGAGPFKTRHDAMTVGELDVDYLLFGALDGELPAQASDLTDWWASTFEIPAVFSDPSAMSGQSHGAEFIAIGEGLWSLPDPAKALSDLVVVLERT